MLENGPSLTTSDGPIVSVADLSVRSSCAPDYGMACLSVSYFPLIRVQAKFPGSFSPIFATFNIIS